MIRTLCTCFWVAITLAVFPTFAQVTSASLTIETRAHWVSRAQARVSAGPLERQFITICGTTPGTPRATAIEGLVWLGPHLSYDECIDIVKARHSEIIELEKISEIARRNRLNDQIRNSGDLIKSAQLEMYGIILGTGDLVRNTFSSDLACGIAQTQTVSKYRFSEIEAIYPVEQCLRDASELLRKIITERQRLDQLVRNEQAAASVRSQLDRERAAVDAERKRVAAAADRERLAVEAERDRLEEEAQRTRAAAEAERTRLADLRSGRAQPQTFQDWLFVTSAANGISLASNPLLNPDNGIYAIAGVIEYAKSTSELQLRVGSYGGYITYVYAQIPSTLAAKIASRARIGSHVWIVGRYVRNLESRAVNGVTRVAPSFLVERIELVD
jgi:hypothetical protein